METTSLMKKQIEMEEDTKADQNAETQIKLIKSRHKLKAANGKPGTKRRLIRALLLLFLIIFIFPPLAIGSIVGYSYYRDYQFKQKALQNELSILRQRRAESIINQENSPTPQSSAKTIIKKSNPSTITETDPPVHCKIADACGGGTKPLKKSECDVSICCQLSDGTWMLTNKTECSSLQKSNTVTPTQQVTQPFSPKTVVYAGGFTYTCDASSADAIKTAYATYEKKVDEAREQSKICTFGTSEDIAKCVETFYQSPPVYHQTFLDLVKRYCL